MNAREGRIIMLGLISGAVLGGLAVLYARMREGQAGTDAAKALAKDINWAELLSLGIAAIGLARRISALSETPEGADEAE
jgi:hypothetical protein